MDDLPLPKKTRLKFRINRATQEEESLYLITGMGNRSQKSKNKLEVPSGSCKTENMKQSLGHHSIGKECAPRKDLKRSNFFKWWPPRYRSCKQSLLLSFVLLITTLQVSNCQKTTPRDRGLFRSEEDFNNFKEPRQGLLQNNNPNFMLRKVPQLQKRLGQLNQLQRITGALSGNVRKAPPIINQTNKNTAGNRPILKNGVPQVQNRPRNQNNRNVALRQKQNQPLILTSDSNRHEIIRNWESYKVKRQNPELYFGGDEPNLNYRYIDVTSEGQVLPPIRRNDRIDEGEDDLVSRPQRPMTYYPNVDSVERNTYFPEEEEKESVERNKRPLRPYQPKPKPTSKRPSLPSLPKFLSKFPSFPATPSFEDNNNRKRQPQIKRVKVVKVKPTVTPRQTSTRTPWTTSVRVPTRKLRKATTKIPQTYYNNRRDGNYYTNEVPLNTKYFQVGDEVPERKPRPTTRPISEIQTSTSKSWFQPTVPTAKSTTSSTTSTATTQLPSQTRPKIPILVKKLAKRPLSKIATPKVVSVQVVRRSGNGDTAFVSSSKEKDNHYGKRLNKGGYKRKRIEQENSALCNGILECDNDNDDDDIATTKRSVRSSHYDKNLTKSNRASDLNEQFLTTSSILSFLPESFDPFVNVLRGEVWVVPILVASSFLVVIILIFEIYLILQSLRERRHRRPASRRHLFLGQVLLLGLLLCATMAVMHALKPTIAVCSVLRIGTGLAYVTVYATLLVKLVFLVSLNSGVYLPATYQSLLLCFAILIQVVIGVQWLVSSPAKVTFIGESEPPLFPEGINAIGDNMNQTKILALNQTFLFENESLEEDINQTLFGETSFGSDYEDNETMLYLKSDELFHDTKLSALTIAYATCNVTFQEEMLGMLYAIFLVMVVVVLAFKARGVRENYREAMYVGLAIGFAVCILLVWVLAAFMVEKRYTDICTACGLVSTAAIIFVIMFMPKGRQLSAMGREGVYAEDRTDVYTGGTGSSTQSTGSGSAGGMFFNQGLHLGEGIGGTPSPSFFPIKPSEKLVQQFRDTPLDGNFSSGKGNNSTLLHHKMPMRDRLATPPLPSSPKKYRPHVHLHHHNASQNGRLPNSNRHSSSSRNNLHDIIDRVLPSENDSSESEILDLTIGSRRANKNTWQNYGSVREIPTVGKNNLPIGGKVANAFCYHEAEASRAATPSITNPNVMFYRRSNSVMASTRSINRSGGSSHFGKHDNFALF